MSAQNDASHYATNGTKAHQQSAIEQLINLQLMIHIIELLFYAVIKIVLYYSI